MTQPSVPNKGHEVAATAYIMIVLCTIAVGLRFWSRYAAHKAGTWWDDWLALLALVFTYGTSALTIYWVSVGLGRHLEQAPRPPLEQAKLLLAFNMLCDITLSLVKMSVLMFYVRVFKTVKVYRLLFWATGFLIIGWFIAFEILNICVCTPVRKQWNRQVPGYCLPVYPRYIASTILNILIDAILLLLPMPIILGIRTEWPRKVGLVIIFAAGYCVILISILRLVSVAKDQSEIEEDITWGTFAPTVLICEYSVGLISCCLPAIFSLLKSRSGHYFSDLFSKFSLSHRLTKSRAIRADSDRKPMDGSKDRGFVPLGGKSRGTDNSLERLYTGPGEAASYTSAFPVSQDLEQRPNSEDSIPLHEIRVRDEVRVERGERMLGGKRSTIA